MKTIKIVGIVGLFVLAIVLIVWSIKKQRTGKDIVTGVSNDKIKKAAESIGLPPAVANAVAQAPDSNAAARRIGINATTATAIANGIEIGNPGVVNTLYGPLSDGGCWSGDTLVNLGTPGKPYFKCEKAKPSPKSV